uniref:Uncharacterized protein n=1 Tax=Arundo donax TaxID=35708 RepID=A0A0A9F842_ARUDO
MYLEECSSTYTGNRIDVLNEK